MKSPIYRGRPLSKGSKSHLRLLKLCVTSPPSARCRRAVFHSKGITINGKVPRTGSMTRNSLKRNKRGKIVSKRKSGNALKQYYSTRSPIRKANKYFRR